MYKCMHLFTVYYGRQTGGQLEPFTDLSNPKRSSLAAKVLLDGDIESAADVLH